MSAATGTFIGSGEPRFVELGFRPDILLIKASDASTWMQMTCDMNWLSRSVPFGSLESIHDAIVLDDSGFQVGTHNDVNKVGATVYWVAMTADDETVIETLSWMGNAIAGRVIALNDTTLTPVCAIVKRDNALPAIWKAGSAVGTSMQDGVQSGGFDTSIAFNTGAITLSEVANVNQLNPPFTGEGLTGLIFGASSFVAQGSWTGNGSTNRDIPLSFAPKLLLVQRTSSSGSTAYVVTPDMPAGFASPSSQTAMADIGVSLTPAGVHISSATTNANSEVYSYLAVGDSGLRPLPNNPTYSGRKAISFPGRGTASGIDCGRSDTLNMTAAYSMEWIGSADYSDLEGDGSAGLMLRGYGSTNSSLNYNWGIYLAVFSEFGHQWSGPSIYTVSYDRIRRGGDIRPIWRSGILMEFARLCHIAVTHDGNGLWKMYRNGRVIKQRQIDLTTQGQGWTSNTKGFSGLRTVLCNYDADNTQLSGINAQPMRFVQARLYNRVLTPAEVVQRYRYEQGEGTDIASGLVEEWDAANAVNGVITARVNSANNGVIRFGSNVTLGDYS